MKIITPAGRDGGTKTKRLLEKADFPNKESYTRQEVSQIINFVMQHGRAPYFVDQYDPYSDPEYWRERIEFATKKLEELK